MIKHIVLLKWKEGTTVEQIDLIDSAFSNFIERRDYIVGFEYGPDLGLAQNEYDYGLVAEFDSLADFEKYVQDGEHQMLMQRLVKPLLAGHTSLQFDC